MDLNTYLDPTIIGKLQTGGYIIMFVFMVIEGPIITFIAAFLASTGIFDIWIVFLLGFLGDIVGDLIFYTFGYITGHHKTTKKFLNSGIIKKLQEMAKSKLLQALIVIKFTPYLPPVGLSMIGAMNIELRKYLITTLGLSLIGPTIFGFAGYHIGLMNHLIPKTPIGIVISVLGACVVLTLLLFTYMKVFHKIGTKTLESNSNL